MMRRWGRGCGWRLLAAFLLGLGTGGFLLSTIGCRRYSLQESRQSSLVLPPAPPAAAPSAPSRRLLYVGIMTAAKYLPSRAAAVFDTWASQVPGKVEFFSSQGSQSNYLPLVGLPGVDDSYPPQKKSFLMLEYIWEHYGNQYEWFLRADDDLYIRPDRLETLLRSIDSSKAFFIGQAGRGKEEEFGLLSLEYDENFCMGGPGVILSREVLRRIAPHLRQCLANLYTRHEDVELGRCVQKFAGVSCTWSYEMAKILYHNSSGETAFTGSLKVSEVHRAITLHPVKQHRQMYRIHNYYKMLKIQELEAEQLGLYRDLLSMRTLLGITPNTDFIFDDIAQFGEASGLTKFVGRGESELIAWEFLQRSLYSATSSNPRRRVEAPLREALDDIIREVMEKINMYSRERGRVIEFKEILYGYSRYNPLYGADYILDLLLMYKKYRGRKMTVPVRRHAYLQQPFNGISVREVYEGEEVVERWRHDPTGSLSSSWSALDSSLRYHLPSILFPSPSSDRAHHQNIHNKLINFILPLSGRFETFRRFIDVFEEVCLKSVERVSLTVVLFPNEKEDSVGRTLDLLKTLQNKYPYAKIEGVPVFEKFARANALQIGAMRVDSPNDLLFFIDVDIVFKRGALQRIRANTVRNKSVYFPIVFSEFDPTVVYNRSTAPDHFVIKEETGYWRQYGFGIGSMYKSDLFKVGGLNTSIRGWGKEDVDLFEKFVSAASRSSADGSLHVFRSVDLELVHVFHPVECDPASLDQLQMRMCRASRADTYGSVNQLSSFVNNNKVNVTKFLRGNG